MPVLLFALPLLVAGQGEVPAGFYNRPGATPAMLAADLRRCRAITARPQGAREERVLTPPIPMPGESPSPGAAPQQRAPAPTLEDCMVTRGWRRYALDAADRARLEALASHERTAALARLTGARCPSHGTLRRDDPRVRLGPAEGW